jgi:DNA modification methylase
VALVTRFHLYFKLFNSIKDEHEAGDLARMELESLFGRVRPIRNFLEEVLAEPLRYVKSLHFEVEDSVPIRLVDTLTYELPYGMIQGYYGVTETLPDFWKLTRRLAYTREYLCLVEDPNGEFSPSEAFPKGNLGLNWQMASRDRIHAMRFITHQFFLENSEYVSKLSRNEDELLVNVETLLHYPTRDFYRIPATETMRIGRRLEDYFALRSEPSLHLTHYMHPYKGKFHPRMARALLNCVYPKDDGVVLDNFAGSGTLLVEAVMMGLDARGVEINPLSTLMTNVKCTSLRIPWEDLLVSVSGYMDSVRKASSQVARMGAGQRFLTVEVDTERLEEIVKGLPKRVTEAMKDRGSALRKMVAARVILDKWEPGPVRDFLALLLSGAISDSFRRTSASFEDVLQSRLNDLCLRLRLFLELKKSLGIPLGDALCFTEDSRQMESIPDASIDAIVNSPPYSTALDYIRNDQPQLAILGLLDGLGEIEAFMIGNPKFDPELSDMLEELNQDGRMDLPDYCVSKVRSLSKGGRVDAALRCLKFFLDMRASLAEMFRVLKRGAKAAIVIGNNHFKVADRIVEVENVGAILQMGLTQGFLKEALVQRRLEKTSRGMIRQEAIIILTKPG